MVLQHVCNVALGLLRLRHDGAAVQTIRRVQKKSGRADLKAILMSQLVSWLPFLLQHKNKGSVRQGNDL